MKITMAHGSGGQETAVLIASVFAKHLSNPILARMEDSAVVEGAPMLAMTTDSFVVSPLFFPGGDIGRLSVCGTVNDLLMGGAVPRYLTCGFILQEGVDTETLERVVASMAQAAQEAGVVVVAGDTKVIEGGGDLYINTAGVGFVREGVSVRASNCADGDVLLVSGTLGDHHAALLSERMGIRNTIRSDCAPLGEMVQALFDHGIRVKAMRDVTRGGLATILNEFTAASHCGIEIGEVRLPVTEQVRSFCGILGLDPLYMGNEGKLLAVVSGEDADRALALMRASRYGEHAALIGRITAEDAGTVRLRTSLGGSRLIPPLYGEGLPRIC